MKQTLNGSSNEKLLVVQWHKSLEHIIATGSADGIVRVWDIKQAGHRQLRFHKSRVRSLLWSSELPWLLISGGDDSNICVWDIRTSNLIFSVKEESISVSCLVASPNQPFKVISAHLDNSVIVWDLLGLSEVAIAQMKMIMDQGITEVCCDIQDLM